MRPCPGCGLSIDDDARFCPTCGWQAPAATAEPAANIEIKPTPQVVTPVAQSSGGAGTARRVLARVFQVAALMVFLSAGFVVYVHPHRTSMFLSGWTSQRLVAAACLAVASLVLWCVSVFIVPATLRRSTPWGLYRRDPGERLESWVDGDDD